MIKDVMKILIKVNLGIEDIFYVHLFYIFQNKIG